MTCGVCGAVVVGAEYDARVYPGRFVKMRFPIIARERARSAS